jgi:hypothetical protein
MSKLNELKIGLITFFQTSNIGTLAQGYCTFQLLKELHEESEVEMLDIETFQRSLFRLKDAMPIISFKSRVFSFSPFKKQVSGRRFLKSHCNLRKVGFFHGIFKPVSILDGLGFDYIYTGSDTVWMHHTERAPDIPNLYFLPPEMGGFKRRAFCVSIDPCKNSIPQFGLLNQCLINTLSGFDRIVVRDLNTKEMVERVAPQVEIQLNFDPTLLYPYQDKLKIDYVNFDNLMREEVLIWCPSLETQSATLLLTRSKYRCTSRFDIDWTLNPIKEEVERMIRFGGLVTDRFHRAILMMKSSDAPVILVESEVKYPLNGSKGRELMESLGLQDYVVRGSNLKNLKGDCIVELISYWTLNCAKERRERLLKIERSAKLKIFEFLKTDHE